MYFYVWNLLRRGKYENMVFACTNDILRSLSITKCKTITSPSLLLACKYTIINSSALSSIVF